MCSLNLVGYWFAFTLEGFIIRMAQIDAVVLNRTSTWPSSNVWDSVKAERKIETWQWRVLQPTDVAHV